MFTQSQWMLLKFQQLKCTST